MGNEINATIRLLVQEEVTSRMKQAREEMTKLQGTADNTKKFVSGLFREFSGPVGAAAAGAALAAFVKHSIEAAAGIEQLHNKASVVFGNDFPQMQAGANGMAAALNRSASDILAFETNLTLVANDLGITGSHAETLSQNMTQLGIDLSKAMGGTQEEAIQAISLALQGSGKALRQYTVALNDDTLQQFANTKGIRDKVAEMSQAQKAYLTEQYLLENTSKIQEIAAKNTGTYTDRVAELKSTWADFLEETGKPLLPAASAVLEGVAVSVHALTEEVEVFLGWWSEMVSSAKAPDYAYHAQKKQTDNLLDLTSSGFSDLNGEKFSRYLKDSTDQVKKFYGALGDPNKAGQKAADELKKVSDSMKDIGKTYQDTTRSVTQKLIDLDSTHRSKMASIRDQIDQTSDSIADLERQYSRSVDEMDCSDADAFIQASSNIEELQKKLDELNRRRQSIYQNGGSIPVDLQDEIDEATTKLQALTTARDKALNTASPEVQDLYNTRSGQTDLERQLADSQRQREEAKLDHDSRLLELDGELTKLKDKQSAEEQAYIAQRTQLELTKAALGSFVSTYTENMANIDKVTQDTVDSLNSKLEQLKSSIASIDSLLQARADLTGGGTLEDKVNERAAGRLNNIPRFGDGGIVYRPTLAIVGEKGPERITPLGKGSTSQSITIGPFYISEKVDINDVVSQITRKIQLASLAV